MKHYLRLITVASALSVSLASCVQDLNTEPIDPKIIQTFNQDEVYYKIYAGLGTSGLKGPNGDNGDDTDIVTDNEGYSVFYRVLFVHEEFPTDAGWWIWNDPGVPDLLECKWTAENSFTSMLYNRLEFNVTNCNHFLENTKDKTDAKSLQQRAEIRFLRALNYYYLMDLFGNPPFSTAVSVQKPSQKEGGRPALYAWLVDELKAAENDLQERSAAGLYRVNKDAARLLLARLYLNAEVYTGTPAWSDAETYAKKITGAYALAPNYAELFMGDNDVNSAAGEIIFSIPQDGNMIQSWGASTAIVCMTRGAGMQPWGSTDMWECWRSTPELLNVFISKEDRAAANIKANEKEMPALLGDDRALFCSYSTNATGEVFEATDAGGAGYGTGNFQKCWAIAKWTGVYSDGSNGKHTQFVDTDVPFFRAGEAFLTYAEALYRQGKTTEALDVLNSSIRSRAHAVALTEINDDVLLDEWQREFYCEGRRRIDLIRFGQFVGHTATRKWEGHSKSSYNKKYLLYPIPNSDCVANPNLTQNDGFN